MTPRNPRKIMKVHIRFHEDINEIKRSILMNMQSFDHANLPSDTQITERIVASPSWQRVKLELCQKEMFPNSFKMKRDRRRLR